MLEFLSILAQHGAAVVPFGSGSVGATVSCLYFRASSNNPSLCRRLKCLERMNYSCHHGIYRKIAAKVWEHRNSNGISFRSVMLQNRTELLISGKYRNITMYIYIYICTYPYEFHNPLLPPYEAPPFSYRTTHTSYQKTS